mmetsp:Transcript_36302/g.43721  ORF Transcript_36302/g.43721 Transcript_36302/m.43721 type:complete len:387 (+) Transcript_36302:251-1411(+)
MSKITVKEPCTLPDFWPPPLVDTSMNTSSTAHGSKSSHSESLSSVVPHPTLGGPWAEKLLHEWGEVSEEEALRRAEQASLDTASPTTLGNDGAISQTSTRLSPYLRWGLLSPRKAYHAGVRKRDLLWRDWSHVCYRLVDPLRKNEPVLPQLDWSCRSSNDGNNINKEDLHNDDDFKFLAWCMGRTGAHMVDASMRQLWVTGWMPRQMRLLSAACLAEGMGVDWRRGRDWFAHTLIDHDPAINELMWQNAGFCGVDPFYRKLRWEANIDDDEYSNDDNGGFAESSGQRRKYTEQWLSAELKWPSTMLDEWEERSCSSSQQLLLLKDVVAGAAAKRELLNDRGIYRVAATVANSGVRIGWKDGSCTGKVWGVGRIPLSEWNMDLHLLK